MVKPLFGLELRPQLSHNFADMALDSERYDAFKANHVNKEEDKVSAELKTLSYVNQKSCLKVK